MLRSSTLDGTAENSSPRRHNAHVRVYDRKSALHAMRAWAFAGSLKNPLCDYGGEGAASLVVVVCVVESLPIRPSF